MKKVSIWLIIIGMFFLAINIQIPLGDIYPNMLTVTEVGRVFQTNVINYFIGTKPAIDIFNDLIGYGLLFVGSLMLMKRSWKFIASILLIPVAAYLYVAMPLMPYHLQGTDLYLKVAGYNFLYVFVEILIEFFVIHGVVTITNCIQNKWHNNEMLAGWIVAMMSQGLLVGITFFFGHNIYYIIYSVIIVGATIFYVNRLFRTLEFNPE